MEKRRVARKGKKIDPEERVESNAEERSREELLGSLAELFVSLKEGSKQCKIPRSIPVSLTHALGLQGTEAPGGAGEEPLPDNHYSPR